MVEDPAATPRKLRRKGGRPSRASASAKALLGVDLTAIDPVAILRAIAADRIRTRQKMAAAIPGSIRERPP